jgi:GWxTD domain-containing protein
MYCLQAYPFPKISYRSLLSLTLVLTSFTGISLAGVSKKELQSLPEHYREWLARDVAYIITDEEKEAFVRLPTDTERDKFIERFWEIRNPSPGSPTNSYKDELYRRIAYANQWFGHNSGIEGWRTDQGRVYITLGAPQQVGKYLGSPNVRPMEIWFYQNAHPALPPFFNVVFYQREAGGEFRLYSPYMDGPVKLISSASSEGDRVSSLTVIDKNLGREVARTVLSLLPDEPVDVQGATSSLQSDVMLATIRNLANHPLNKDLLNERRRVLEEVTHRIVLGGDYLDVLTVPLRDRDGAWNLHFALRFKKPEDFTILEAKNGRYYYNAEVVAKVGDANGKPLFEQRRKLSEFIDAAKLESIKNKVFGYEGLLPLAPGKYKVEFLLSNESRKSAFRDQRDILIPDTPASGLRVSDVVPFTEATASHTDLAPFTVAGVEFTPTSNPSPALVPGQDLKVFYQIWTPAEAPQSLKDGSLAAEYAYGRLGLHDTKTIYDEVSKAQFDSSGAMVNGKKISTIDFATGNYRLAVTVSDPQTRSKAFASLQFRVTDSEPSSLPWDVSDPQLSSDLEKGTLDYDRALCYVAQGDIASASRFFRAAFQRNPQDEIARTKLVEAYFAQKDFAQIAEVYSRSGISDKTDEQTVLRIAESLDRIGDLSRATSLLETAIALKPMSAPVYLTLASYYQRAGNSARAAEIERKARGLITSAKPSS